MTYIATSAGRRPESALSRVLTGFAKPFQRLVIRLRVQAELSTMDDRMLRDIGVPRDQIYNLARRHAEATCA